MQLQLSGDTLRNEPSIRGVSIAVVISRAATAWTTSIAVATVATVTFACMLLFIYSMKQDAAR